MLEQQELCINKDYRPVFFEQINLCARCHLTCVFIECNGDLRVATTVSNIQLLCSKQIAAGLQERMLKVYVIFSLEDGIGSMDAAVKGTISIIPDKEVVLITLTGLSTARIFFELFAESLFDQYLNE